MAPSGHVPKFGNWKNEDNVPYTVYYDQARKNKDGGKMINPDDPQENPKMFANTTLLKPRTRPEQPVRPMSDHRSSREDGEFTQLSNSQGSNEIMDREHRHARQASSPWTSAASDQSSERPTFRTARESESSESNRGTPVTPIRSWLRPLRGDESSEKWGVVPRFGQWNENDPQSAENFTHIFNKVREERNTGAGNVMGTPNHPYPHNQPSNEPKKCCFPWW